MAKKYNLLLCLVFTGLLALLLPSCGAKYETIPGDPTHSRIYTLENGLKVYMNVNKDEPRINAHIAVKVGGKNDPHETTGLAHYFEHLMFKGTESFGTQNYALEKPLLDQIEAQFEIYRKTEDETERKAIYRVIDSLSYEASKLAIPNEYDKLMAAIGASGTNAYTGYDQTVYVENIPSNQLENWAKIQSDRFANAVIRGFHTELETVYEEKNMSLTNDTRKMYDAMFSSLFKNHPYGLQTVLGSQEHLKNPSITNIKNYYDNWYVPNNMAICLSGDFDPNYAIDVIEKYFSSLEPNPDLKYLEFEPEAPITEPIVTEVYGLESPSILLAWRFPASNDPENLKLQMLANVLYNGQAGLVDINVNHAQKVLSLYGGIYGLADYSVLMFIGQPKEGQSLEEVKSILMEQVDKLKKGDFDESLIESTANHYKLGVMQTIESSYGMVNAFVNSFINDEDLSTLFTLADDISAITKDELVAYANANLGNNYAEVHKLQGKDPNELKIEKPEITPIMMNRDTSSQFLRDIMVSQVTPIEPVFVDFEKDMDILTAKSEIPVLYKKNETNDIFSLIYMFETGSNSDKVLSYAMQYLDFLGTEDMTPAEVKAEFYRLACSYNIFASREITYAVLEGLSENMDEAMELFESLVAGAVANPEALTSMKSNIIKNKENAKADQMSNFNALQYYGFYGKNNPILDDLSNKEVLALNDQQLLDRIHNLFSLEHRVLYYGPLGHEDILAAIEKHHNVPEELTPVDESKKYKPLLTEKSKIYLAPYESNQIYMVSISNRGETYDPEIVPIATLYNEYFGGGMNSIVFQEMRESRGLAYSASAWLSMPSEKDDYITYGNFIATQNDKMIDAIEAFDEIINNMPESENAFNIAKDNLLTNLRTKRIIKSNVLWTYLEVEKLGIDYDYYRDIFEKVQGYTLQDVIDFQQKMVKDRTYTICILGDPKSLDLKSLKEYGELKQLSTEEIFGY